MKQPAIVRHRKPALTIIVALVVVLGLPAARASAHQPPKFTAPPVIVGEATVGSTLEVKPEYTQGALDPGDPPVDVSFQWRRCPSGAGACVALAGAISDTYVVTSVDLGQRLEVRVTLANSLGQKSATTPPTSIVTTPPAPAPPPSPPPTTPPPPATNPGVPPAFDTSGSSSPAPTSSPRATTSPASVAARVRVSPALPAYLRPFPIVRIRGFLRPGGARITLLSVQGPRGATVRVRCSSRGCPVRTLGPLRAPTRLRAFERYLPAGLVLEVRVVKGTRVGKFTRLVIRARRAPARRDACLMPGRARPVRCPVAR